MNYHNYRSELMLEEGLTKEAGPALDAAIKAVKNVPTLGGAAAGSVYGGIKGHQNANEGQGAAGALGGAVIGGVAGGFLGGGARNLYKNVPKGYKQWRAGHKDLAKELKASGIKPEDAKFWSMKNIKSYVPFTQKGKRYKYVDDKGKAYKRVAEQMGAGKRGKELIKSDAAAAKEVGAYGDVLKGRHRMVGGALGGALGVGYGGYQLKNVGDIAKKTDEEKNLDRVEKNIDEYKAVRNRIRSRQGK